MQTIYDRLANNIEYRCQSPMNPGGAAVVLMSRRLNPRRRAGIIVSGCECTGKKEKIYIKSSTPKTKMAQVGARSDDRNRKTDNSINI